MIESDLNIITTSEHDRDAIQGEIADNESFYNMVIIVSIFIIIVVLIL